MSRQSDSLYGSTQDTNLGSVTQIKRPDDRMSTSPPRQFVSISSPLEALAIDGQLKESNSLGQTTLAIDKEPSNRQQANDKERGTMIDTPDSISQASTSLEAIKTEHVTGNENGIPTQPAGGLKAEPLTIDYSTQALQQIKKEDSQGPVLSQELQTIAQIPTMPFKGPPKKKSAPGGPKKPSAKKRKLDSRADTPQSQRSGTPNSVLGGKSGSRIMKQNSATPLHSSPGPDDEEDDDDESDDGLYCICRKGDDHTWMIGCDGGCDDWFHGRCIGIDQRDGNLIDKFICPNCSESKGAETTWKPMCRLESCREPAAITAPRPSKYCCDDHAAQFFRRFIKKGLGNDTLSAAKKRRKEDLTDNFQNYSEDYDKPAHLRGGLLSPAELKTITDGLQSCKDFRSLGESVPVVDEHKPIAEAMDIDTKHERYTANESDLLNKTTGRTEKLRYQLKSLEDRERFLALVKSRAKIVSEDLKKKDKSMKDMCGFDSRLRWSDEDFDIWCSSEDGREAFSSNKLKPNQTDADGDANMADTDEPDKGMCLRKRCKQHEGWYKLHSLEFTYGKSDVSREISRLGGEEQGIHERATIRLLEAKAGTQGVDGYL